MGLSAPLQHVVDLVEGIAAEWQHRCALSHFEIRHVFLDAYYPDDDEDTTFKITAVTETRHEYLEAVVTWYLRTAVLKTDAELEGTLVHELGHVALAPEQAIIEDALNDIADDADYPEIAYETMQKLYYERQETATELYARAVYSGWGSLLD